MKKKILQMDPCLTVFEHHSSLGFFSYFHLPNKQEEHMEKEVVSILPPKARFSTPQTFSICEEV